MGLILLIGHADSLLHIAGGIGKAAASGRHLGTVGIAVRGIGETTDEVLDHLDVGGRVELCLCHIQRQQSLVQVLGQVLLDLRTA